MSYSKNGFFNEFGGKYVAEVLRRPLDELEVEFKKSMAKARTPKTSPKMNPLKKETPSL